MNVCECGRVSIITEINSSPLFPLQPHGSVNTPLQLSASETQPRTHVEARCVALCVVHDPESAGQRDSAACESMVPVFNSDLQTERPAVQGSREGDDYWL